MQKSQPEPWLRGTHSELQVLGTEVRSHSSLAEIFNELSAAFTNSSARIVKLAEEPDTLNQPRTVGRKNLPTARCRPPRTYRRSHPKACRAGDNDGKDFRRAAWTNPLTMDRFDSKRS